MAISASCAARVEAPQRTRMRWQPALDLGMGIGAGCFRAKRIEEWRNANAQRGRWNENPPTKRPRRSSEGVRVPRRSDRPISAKEDQPWWRSKPDFACCVQPIASRRMREGSERQWRWRAAFIGKIRWNLVTVVQRVLRSARTLHPAFSDCKHFFHNPAVQARKIAEDISKHARRGPATHRRRTKNRATGVALQSTTHRGRRIADPCRENCSRNGFDAARRGYGSSTLSITWITPLLW